MNDLVYTFEDLTHEWKGYEVCTCKSKFKMQTLKHRCKQEITGKQEEGKPWRTLSRRRRSLSVVCRRVTFAQVQREGENRGPFQEGWGRAGRSRMLSPCRPAPRGVGPCNPLAPKLKCAGLQMQAEAFTLLNYCLAAFQVFINPLIILLEPVATQTLLRDWNK